MNGPRPLWSVFERTSDLVQSVRPDGGFEYVNKAWLEAMNYTEAEVSGLKLSNTVFPGSLKKVRSSVDQVLRGKTLRHVEFVLLSKNGDQVFVEGSLFPRLEEGTPVACQGIFRNVTETKEVQQRLEEEQSKTEFFVDLMIHDLTNINQEIISAMEVLLFEPSLPKGAADLARETLTEVERASRLISNVRKLTRISKRSVTTVTYDLSKTLNEAAEAVAREFPTKRMNLKNSLKAGEYLVSADEFFPDVFRALLHNAMKSDDSSEVEIEVRADYLPKTPFLKLQIMDHGHGIPDDQKERVFDMLTPRRETLLGFGLGLTLVKRVLGNYGAFIRVEDRVPNQHTKGANFVILMRYERGPNTDKREAE